jgi:hypothetical protein
MLSRGGDVNHRSHSLSDLGQRLGDVPLFEDDDAVVYKK